MEILSNLRNKIQSLKYIGREDIENVTKVIAVSIYADKTIRDEEIREANNIVSSLYCKDTATFLEKNILLRLEYYKSNPAIFYEEKKEAVELSKNHEIYSTIMDKIFLSDYELHEKEDSLKNKNQN